MADIPPYPGANQDFSYARSPVEIGLSSAVNSLRNSYLQRAEYEKSLAEKQAKAQLDKQTQNREDQYLQIAKDQLSETKRQHDLEAQKAANALAEKQRKYPNPYAKFGFGEPMDDPKVIGWYQNQYNQKQSTARAKIQTIRTSQDMQKFLLSTYEITDPNGQVKRAPVSTLFDSETQGTDILGQPTVRTTKRKLKGQGLPGGPSFLNPPSGLLGGPSFPSSSGSGGISGGPTPATPNVVDDIVNKWH